MSSTVAVSSDSPEASLDVAKFLWEEYKYRHDLIWRLLFRVTAGATLLSIAPFTINDLVELKAGLWIKALPAVALVLVLASWYLLVHELRLFSPVDKHYTKAQNSALSTQVREAKKIDVFKWIVYLYPRLLFLLVAVAAYIVWFQLELAPG